MAWWKITVIGYLKMGQSSHHCQQYDTVILKYHFYSATVCSVIVFWEMAWMSSLNIVYTASNVNRPSVMHFKHLSFLTSSILAEILYCSNVSALRHSITQSQPAHSDKKSATITAWKCIILSLLCWVWTSITQETKGVTGNKERQLDFRPYWKTLCYYCKRAMAR